MQPTGQALWEVKRNRGAYENDRGCYLRTRQGNSGRCRRRRAVAQTKSPRLVLLWQIPRTRFCRPSCRHGCLKAVRMMRIPA